MSDGVFWGGGPWRLVPGYVAAQMLGSALGGYALLLALGLYPQPVFELADSAVTQALAARGAP